jgi:glycosyltransferase involved in cell wall biosynthesis
MLPLAVIIPAFNGAQTLKRSLVSLAGQDLGTTALLTAGIHVLVVVNDGQKETFAAAEAHLPALRKRGIAASVIVSSAGRVAALQAGESHVPALSHRVYLDQDAFLSSGALAALAEGFCRPGIGFATLAPVFEPSVSAAVRCFCRAWVRLPYVRRSPATMGLYAVSAQGRARWGDWPHIAADDKAVRLLFRPAERLLIENETYRVLPPASWGELIDTRARYVRSNRELTTRGHRDAVSLYAGLLEMMREPDRWGDFTVLAVAHAAAKVQANRPRSAPRPPR